MFQNEGIDEKENSMQEVHKSLHSLKRVRGGGEGGSQVGYLLAVSQFVTFLNLQSLYILSRCTLLFLISGKPCWFCWINLNVLQFLICSFIVFCNNLQAKKGGKGVKILEI